MSAIYYAGYDDDYYLMHHGIKGQKWGIRRFQDKSGSLTPAGKKRYRTDKKDPSRMSDEELRKRVDRLRLEKQYNDLNDDPRAKNGIKAAASGLNLALSLLGVAAATKGSKNPGDNPAEAYKKVVDASKRTTDTAGKFNNDVSKVTKTNKSAKQLSDADLKRAVSRLQMEKQYSELMNSKSRRQGQERAQRILETTGMALGVASSALAIAVYAKQLRGK